jgi:hypothetical protein
MVAHLLDGIVKDAEAGQFAWQPMDMGDEVREQDATARSYAGVDMKGARRILVVSFDVGRPDIRGYDGTYTHGLTIIRLPREQAGKLFEIAENACR